MLRGMFGDAPSPWHTLIRGHRAERSPSILKIVNVMCEIIRGAIWESPTWGLPQSLSHPRGPRSDSRCSSDCGEGPRTLAPGTGDFACSLLKTESAVGDARTPLPLQPAGFEKWQGVSLSCPKCSLSSRRGSTESWQQEQRPEHRVPEVGPPSCSLTSGMPPSRQREEPRRSQELAFWWGCGGETLKQTKTAGTASWCDG